MAEGMGSKMQTAMFGFPQVREGMPMVDHIGMCNILTVTIAFIPVEM